MLGTSESYVASILKMHSKLFIHLVHIRSLTIKEGSALPRQSPTLPRGLDGGEPPLRQNFTRKKSFMPERLSCFLATSKVGS
jgi:hypothetical protein